MSCRHSGSGLRISELDVELDVEKAHAAPTNHSGSGSTLFRAVTLRSTGLVRLSLLHPDVKHVVNGTATAGLLLRVVCQ